MDASLHPVHGAGTLLKEMGTQALPVGEQVPFPGNAAPRTEGAPVPTAIQGFSVP